MLSQVLRSAPFFAGAVATCLWLAVAIDQVKADPVAIEFLPPKVDVKAVCVQRAPDGEVIDRWVSWDRKTLPKLQPWIIQREAQRLRDIDPELYFPIISRMIELLPDIDRSLKPRDLEADRITLYLRAGKIKELESNGALETFFTQAEAGAPKDLDLAAELILTGVVAQKDKAKALSYLVNAAYGGNPNALLQLAKRNLDGERVEGWSVDPSLAITMAFGAMVGKLDSGICDRVARIAREYEKGDVVKQDRAISEAWLRFAADLADGNAAWKVARYHLESADIRKDNAVLLHYLKFAADNGVIAAQSELAHVYEVGAIVTKDLEKSEYYYRQAVAAGHRSSLIRLANLYGESDAKDAREKYVQALNELASLEDAPGWAFARLANLAIDKDGFWKSHDQASKFFQQGADRRDMTSMHSLAALRLSSTGDGNFDEGINLLLALLDNFGRTDTMKDLRDAYLCHAPDGPRIEQAEYWSNAAKGSQGSAWSVEDIDGLVHHLDDPQTALLQSGALNGQPKAIAGYLWYLTSIAKDADAIKEWEGRLSRSPDAEAAFAALMLQAAGNDIGKKRAALDRFLSAADLPSSAARIGAGELILSSFAEDPRLLTTAEKYLRLEASHGNGKAMQLLATKFAAPAEIYNQYRLAIVDRGDADASIFAARYVSDVATKEKYLLRAQSLMDCSFDSALSMAHAYIDLREPEKAQDWMDVGETFSKDKPWRARVLAEAYSTFPSPVGQDSAMRLFEVAARGGDARAEQYLLKTYTDRQGQQFSLEKATTLMIAVIQDASADRVASRLNGLAKSHKTVYEQLLARIDLTSIYERSAQSGDPVGMREYAKLKLANSGGAEAASSATDLFRKAADKGDSEAMVLLAQNYAYGIGTRPSLPEAKLWLEKAARLGSKQANEMLSVMSTKVN